MNDIKSKKVKKTPYYNEGSFSGSSDCESSSENLNN